MKGILMGCSTVDIQGLPLTLVIPNESVSDPLLSYSLVSAGRLMEGGFEVIFRLPQNASTLVLRTKRRSQAQIEQAENCTTNEDFVVSEFFPECR